MEQQNMYLEEYFFGDPRDQEYALTEEEVQQYQREAGYEEQPIGSGTN